MNKIRAAGIAIIVGLIVFGTKLIAYLMSGSVALLSDALESIVNIAASLLLFFAIYVSDLPADENHKYGHQKIENISSMVEGFLILIAALFIIHEALDRISNPVALTKFNVAISISLFATGLNGGLSWFLSRIAREWGSAALEGDAKHLLSDVITSIGVATGLFIAQFTGWDLMDPLIAILVSAIIVRLGGGLVIKSAQDLMDQSCIDTEAKIAELLNRHQSQFVDFHDVKTRRSGIKVFAELHLSVNSSLTVEEAHTLTDHLEEKLKVEMPNVNLTIHIEPASV